MAAAFAPPGSCVARLPAGGVMNELAAAHGAAAAFLTGSGVDAAEAVLLSSGPW